MTMTEPTVRRRPWSALRPKPRKPDVVAAPEVPPLAELRIYKDLVLLTRRGARGSWRSYPVSPDAVAQVFTRAPSATGLLPPFTLGAGRVAGVPFTVVWRPPQITTVQTERRLYRVPLPPLVWAGCGREYRVWALGEPEYPTRDASLFVAPLPNCYRSGAICWGNVAGVPEATSAAQLLAARALFLEESAFNAHVDNDKSVRFRASVIAHWRALEEEGAEVYPLDDLLPAECSLSWLLGGGPWAH